MAKLIELDEKTRKLLNDLDEIPEVVNRLFAPIEKELREGIPEIPSDLTKLSDDQLVNYRLIIVRWIEFLDNELSRINEKLVILKEKKNVLAQGIIESLVKGGLSKAAAKEQLQHFDEYNHLHLDYLLYSLLQNRYETKIRQLGSLSTLLSREQTRRGDEARRFVS